MPLAWHDIWRACSSFTCICSRAYQMCLRRRMRDTERQYAVHRNGQNESRVIVFIDNLLYTIAEQKSIRPYIACDIVDMHYIIYVYASL